MIPARRATEPKDFETKVRSIGNKWLRTHPDAKRPPALWIPFTPDLERAYKNLCGYAAMLDPTGGTIDHFKSIKNHLPLAYEWSNYRFASGIMNSSKRTADESVLDPEEVGASWFEILLPSLQMRLTNRVPADLRTKAEFTLQRLKLDKGLRVIRWRRAWYKLYQEGKLNLEGLRDVAPLIAEAVERANSATTSH